MAAIFIKRIGNRYVSTDEATALMATAAKFGIAIPEGNYEPQVNEFGYFGPADSLRHVIGDNKEAREYLLKTFGKYVSGDFADAVVIANLVLCGKDEILNEADVDLDIISRLAYTLKKAHSYMEDVKREVKDHEEA